MARPGRRSPDHQLTRSPNPSGLYLHVPFCASICNYCNFNRGLLDEGLKQAYVDALAREIGMRATGEPVDTIYFGGGTPSLLSPDEAARLMQACRESFDVVSGAEVTFEVNPETVTRATLEAFRDAGVNRLSIGVQSFDDDELARLDRRHDAARARRACADARAAGFDNISIDLIYGIPGQSLDDWRDGLARAVALEPDHVSCYALQLALAPDEWAARNTGWSNLDTAAATSSYSRSNP